MTIKQIEKESQNSVKKELIKKAKLGQYAIVQKNGKTIRILASELLKEKN